MISFDHGRPSKPRNLCVETSVKSQKSYYSWKLSHPITQGGTDVDGSEIRRSPVEVGSLPHQLQGFYTSQVVSRISSIFLGVEEIHLGFSCHVTHESTSTFSEGWWAWGCEGLRWWWQLLLGVLERWKFLFWCVLGGLEKGWFDIRNVFEQQNTCFFWDLFKLVCSEDLTSKKNICPCVFLIVFLLFVFWLFFMLAKFMACLHRPPLLIEVSAATRPCCTP